MQVRGHTSEHAVCRPSKVCDSLRRRRGEDGAAGRAPLVLESLFEHPHCRMVVACERDGVWGRGRGKGAVEDDEGQ